MTGAVLWTARHVGRKLEEGNRGLVPSFPRILTAGDSTMFVEFGDSIDPTTNQKAIDFAARVDTQSWTGVVETVPTYRSTAVYFDPLVIHWSELVARLVELLSSPALSLETISKLVRIPVAYGEDFGPDIGFVAKHNGIGENEVIRLHSSKPFRVFMLGFAPGFPYLGELPEKIRAPRLSSPRLKVPAGSVGIAGNQTGIYPMELPGGWRLIGRTPVALFDADFPTRFPFGPGDRIQFVPISKEDFDRWGKHPTALERNVRQNGSKS